MKGFLPNAEAIKISAPLTPEAWCIILCFGGFFLASGSTANVVPLYILAIWTLMNPLALRARLRELSGNTLFQASLMLILYWCISVFWARVINLEAAFKAILHGLLLINVFIAFYSASRTMGSFPLFLCKAVATLGAVSAFISLVSLLFGAQESGRLEGYGRLDNSVIAGIGYGFALVLALCFLKSERNNPIARYWLVVSLVLLLAVVFSETRLAILAVVGSMVFVGLETNRRKAIRLVAGGATVLLLTVMLLSGLLATNPISPVQEVWQEGQLSPLNSNSQFDEIDRFGRPAGVKAVYHSYGDELSASDGTMTLSHPSQSAIAAGWRALAVEAGEFYVVKVTLRGEEKSPRGLFVAFHERDDLPDGASHIALNPGRRETGVVEYESQTNFALDAMIPEQWSTYYYGYVAPETASWVSLVISNWVGNGVKPLYLDEVSIYKSESALARIIHHLREVGWISKGFSERDWIWLESAQHALRENLLLGTGYSGVGYIGKDMDKLMQHPHSVFVAQFYYGGLIGFMMLCGVLFQAIRCLSHSYSLEYTICSAALCFACLALAFDGNRLVDKVNIIWLVFWLPIIMLVQQDESKSTKNQC
jgi:hypothetical protein